MYDRPADAGYEDIVESGGGLLAALRNYLEAWAVKSWVRDEKPIERGEAWYWGTRPWLEGESLFFIFERVFTISYDVVTSLILLLSSNEFCRLYTSSSNLMVLSPQNPQISAVKFPEKVWHFLKEVRQNPKVSFYRKISEISNQISWSSLGNHLGGRRNLDYEAGIAWLSWQPRRWDRLRVNAAGNPRSWNGFDRWYLLRIADSEYLRYFHGPVDYLPRRSHPDISAEWKGYAKGRRLNRGEAINVPFSQ